MLNYIIYLKYIIATKLVIYLFLVLIILIGVFQQKLELCILQEFVLLSKTPTSLPDINDLVTMMDIKKLNLILQH